MAMYNPWYTYCSFCKVHRQGVSYLGLAKSELTLDEREAMAAEGNERVGEV
jgi:hypothetical protein